MYTPTITKSELLEWDLLFYRWNRPFSWIIRIYEAVRANDITRLFIAFTHVAQMVYNRDLDRIQRFDAMESLKTGFRMDIGKAYVFRWKVPLTEKQLMLTRSYLIARQWSNYDLFGAFSQVDDVFADYCSELTKNSLVASGKIKDSQYLSPYQFYKKYRSKLISIWVII